MLQLLPLVASKMQHIQAKIEMHDSKGGADAEASQNKENNSIYKQKILKFVFQALN